MRKLITTDSHLGIPPWLADDLPAESRALLPHVEERPDGRYLVRPERNQGRRNRYSLAKMVDVPPEVMMSVEAGYASEVKVDDDAHLETTVCGAAGVPARAGFGVEGRLADMELEGVVAAVLIGGDFGVPPAAMPLDVQIAWSRIKNDWMVDTFKDHFDRFAPGIHLPLGDIGASVRELERAAGLGLRPVLLPEGINGRPYWGSEWEPLWEAADGLGVPVTMHISNFSMPREWFARFDEPFGPIVSFYAQSCLMGESPGLLAMSGILQKYPRLTLIATEGYAHWLAGLMQHLDHHWGETLPSQGRYGALGRAAVKLEAPPSFFLKRQVHATFMWDPVAIANRQFTGIDSLLWANDYPHQEGSFPSSQAWVEKQFAGVPEDEIEQMTYGNAVRVFGFDV